MNILILNQTWFAEELRAMARSNDGMDVSKEAEALDRKAEAMLKDLGGKKPEALVKDRRQKYLDMGSKGLAA
jgi:hypothetical protein